MGTKAWDIGVTFLVRNTALKKKMLELTVPWVSVILSVRWLAIHVLGYWACTGLGEDILASLLCGMTPLDGSFNRECLTNESHPGPRSQPATLKARFAPTLCFRTQSINNGHGIILHRPQREQLHPPHRWLEKMRPTA